MTPLLWGCTSRRKVSGRLLSMLIEMGADPWAVDKVQVCASGSHD